jgi:single-stranded DNA-binding protein
MFSVQVTGLIHELVERQITNSRGEEQTMVVMKFRSSVRRRTQEGNYENETRFCEAVAFGKTADIWLKRFEPNMPVEVAGELHLSSYVKQDGSVGVTYKIQGFDGAITPGVNWAPTPRQDRQQAPQVDF